MGDVEYELLDEAMNKSAKKPLTKAAIAKKVLKKNIIANKKVMFTDTGDVSLLSCVYYIMYSVFNYRWVDSLYMVSECFMQYSMRD